MSKNPTDYQLLSHTDRTLAQHLSGCYDIAQKVIADKWIHSDFIDAQTLQYLIRLLVYLHDLGKATVYFQHRIITATQEQNPPFAQVHRDYIYLFEQQYKTQAAQELKRKNKLGNHAALGAYVQFALNQLPDEALKLLSLHIIKRHHGELLNCDTDAFCISDDELSILQQQQAKLFTKLYLPILQSVGLQLPTDEQWQQTCQLFTRLRKTDQLIAQLLQQNTALRYFFMQHFLFSVLLSADKGDVMTSDKNIVQPNLRLPQNLIDLYKQCAFGNAPAKPIDRLREQAYQHIAQHAAQYAQHHFFSITLPTGMGKTLSAYNAAVVLQNAIATHTPRIIYCLPFTSIIDQNEAILTDIFQSAHLPASLIAKNHHLAPLNDQYNEYQLTYSEAEYLTEGWEQEVVVTTFVQLLESIFTNRNKALRKFHNMCNAIILLDEVQNIPAKYFPLIEVAFEKMAHYFNTKFVFITATQPMVMSQPNNQPIELTDPTQYLTQQYFTLQNRTQLFIGWIKNNPKITDEELTQHIQADLDQYPQRSTLVICNTIKQAQALFMALNPPHENKYFLSSGILPFFRKQIIETIKNNTANGIPQLLVSTQVVEAGVDIDFEMVYRDFAPLDSINQSAGRCNRNGLQPNPGTVHLFDSGKARWIYDPVLLQITRTLLQQYPDELIPETEFYQLNRAYFASVKKYLQDDNATAQELIGYLQNLSLQKLADKFKLIQEKIQAYNVFMPINEHAEQIWQTYCQYQTLPDHFERKRAIKQLMPQLLQYTTRFPKQHYKPAPHHAEHAFIYEPNWQQYYHLQTGFQLLTPEEESVVFF